MADPTTTSLLKRLVLSAAELQQLTDWPAALIEDYLNIFDDLVTLAERIDSQIDEDLEEIDTNFLDKTIPFVDGGHLAEDNPDFTWDQVLKVLNVNGTISGTNRAKQYYFAGF